MINIAPLIIIGIGIIVYFAVKRKKETAEYNKLDKSGFVLNIVLGLFYIPFSFVSVFVGAMMGDGLYFKNPMIVALIYVLYYICLYMPFFCGASITASSILRKRGYSRWSFYINFVPIMILAISVGIILLAGGGI